MASRLTLEEETLAGKDRKAFAFRRHKIARDAGRAAATAQASHGAGFARSWHPRTLSDRAGSHGLSDEYEFFRLASAVLHGSAGGLIGTWESGEFGSIHRLGIALTLCPPALRYGLQFFKLTLDAFRPRVGDAVDEAAAATRAFVDRWPDYRRVVLALDAEMWPDFAPPGYAAVVVVPPVGNHRWFIHDVYNDRIREAHPPDALPAEQADALQSLLDQPRGSETHTMLMMGVSLNPRADRPWRPDIEVLGNRQQLGLPL